MKRVCVTICAVILATMAAEPSAATRQRSGDNFTIKRSEMSREGQVYAETIDMLFNAHSTGLLSLGTSIGSVNVETWSEDKVRLVVTKRTRAANVTDARRILEMFRIQALQGGTDLAFTARARTRECAESLGVVFTIWVPRSYDLDIKTKNGDIDLPELVGKYSAYTADGVINVDVDTDDLDIEVEDRTGQSDSEEDAGSPGTEEPAGDETGSTNETPAAGR